MKITNKYYLIDNDLRSIVIVESASTIDIVSISRYRLPSSRAHAKLVNKGITRLTVTAASLEILFTGRIAKANNCYYC